MDVPETKTVIWQKEEDLKTCCPSSGENAGRMIPLAVSDEWKARREWSRIWPADGPELGGPSSGLLDGEDASASCMAVSNSDARAMPRATQAHRGETITESEALSGPVDSRPRESARPVLVQDNP
jgi:hypothetical protein